MQNISRYLCLKSVILNKGIQEDEYPTQMKIAEVIVPYQNVKLIITFVLTCDFVVINY